MIVPGQIGSFVGSCAGKKWYYDLTRAERAARDVEAKYGYKIRPYRCGYCPHFHLSRVRESDPPPPPKVHCQPKKQPQPNPLDEHVWVPPDRLIDREHCQRCGEIRRSDLKNKPECPAIVREPLTSPDTPAATKPD